MPSLQYDDIISSFLGKVNDYDFLNLDENDVNSILAEKLHSVVSQPYISRLFKTLSLDDDIGIINFSMDYSWGDTSDKDFVREMLAKGLVIEWLTPQVRSKLNVSQFFGGKEQKYYSQANHIAEIRGLLEDVKLEVRKMIRDRGYIKNTYLDD